MTNFENLQIRTKELRSRVALALLILINIGNLLQKPQIVHAANGEPWHVVCKEGNTNIQHDESNPPEIPFNNDVNAWGHEACIVFTGEDGNYIQSWVGDEQSTDPPPTANPEQPTMPDDPQINQTEKIVTLGFANCPEKAQPSCEAVQQSIIEGIKIWEAATAEYTNTHVIFTTEGVPNIIYRWGGSDLHPSPNLGFNGCGPELNSGYYFPYSTNSASEGEIWLNNNYTWQTNAPMYLYNEKCIANPEAVGGLHETGHYFWHSAPTYGHNYDWSVMNHNLAAAYNSAKTNTLPYYDLYALKVLFGSNGLPFSKN